MDYRTILLTCSIHETQKSTSMQDYIEFDILKRVSIALLLENELSDKRLKQIDPRLSSQSVQKAFATWCNDMSIQALLQFTLSCV